MTEKSPKPVHALYTGVSEPVAQKRNERIPPWISVLMAILGGPFALMLALGVGAAMAFAITDSFTPEMMTQAVTDLRTVGPSVSIQNLGFCAVALLACWFGKARPRTALGLKGAHPAVFLLAPVGILALGPTSDALVRLMKYLAPNWTFGALNQIEAITAGHSVWVLLPFLALAPGLGEEFFFRGLVQRSWGDGWRAITISALSFSAFHMDPHHVAGVIPLGFYLAWLGARTGSLWVCVVTHTANNAVATFASKYIEDDGDEAVPWWAIPIGWAIAALVIWGIRHWTAPRAASAEG
ncbi:MAG: CPBP family intramembrane glutamic endopeptidase [Myxococcota bacterium]